MSNFSEYINKESENLKCEKNIDSDKTKNLEELIDKYSQLNQNDLFSEFLRLTYQKKKNGELGKTEIDNIRTTIVPYLNEQQKTNLLKILEMVENV